MENQSPSQSPPRRQKPAVVIVMETPELVLHILQYLPRYLLFKFRRINWTWYHAVHQYRLSMGELYAIAREEFESRPRRIYTLSSYMLQYGPMTHEARASQGKYKFIFSCQARSGSGDSASSSDSSAAGGLVGVGDNVLGSGSGSRSSAPIATSSHAASGTSSRGSGSESHSHESSHLWIDHDELQIDPSQEPYRSFRTYRSSAIVPNISFLTAPSSSSTSLRRRQRAESVPTATSASSSASTGISLSDLPMTATSLRSITSGVQAGGMITAAGGDLLTEAGGDGRTELLDTVTFTQGTPRLESLSISSVSQPHATFSSHAGSFYSASEYHPASHDVATHSQHPLDPTPSAIGLVPSTSPLQPALTSSSSTTTIAGPSDSSQGMYRVVPCPYEHAHEESRCAMSSSIDETHYVPIKTSRSGSESEEIFHGYHGDTPLHSPMFADKGKGKAFMQRHDHPDHFTEGGDSRGGVGGSGSNMPPDIVEDTGEGAHSLRDESLLGTAVVRTTTSTTESSGLAGSLTDDPSFLSSSFSGHPSSSESERRLSSESSTHTTTASISEGIGFSSSTLSTPTAAGHSGGGSGHINIGLSPVGGHGGGNNNTYNISHHLHYSSSGSTNNNNGGNNQGGAAFSMRDPNWTAKVETFYFRQAAINAMIVACRNYMRANERYGAAVIERTTTSRIVWNEATRQEFIWTVTPTLLDRSNPVEQELDYDESETSFMY